MTVFFKTPNRTDVDERYRLQIESELRGIRAIKEVGAIQLSQLTV